MEKIVKRALLAGAILMVVGGLGAGVVLLLPRPQQQRTAPVDSSFPIAALEGLRLGDSKEAVERAVGPLTLDPANYGSANERWTSDQSPWGFILSKGELRVADAMGDSGAEPKDLGMVLGQPVTLGGTTKAELVAALGDPDHSDPFGVGWVSGQYLVGFAYEDGRLVRVSVQGPLSPD